jgi:hypothetical protein
MDTIANVVICLLIFMERFLIFSTESTKISSHLKAKKQAPFENIFIHLYNVFRMCNLQTQLQPTLLDEVLEQYGISNTVSNCSLSVLE